MKVLKKCLRQIALALAVALLVPMMAPAAKAEAAERKQRAEEEVIYYGTVEMGEDSYLEIKETSSSTTSVYYVDGVVVQRAVYDKETGEIVCYDNSQKAGNTNARTYGQTRENVVTYHIDDFKMTGDGKSAAYSRSVDEHYVYDSGAGTGTGYSYLMSRTYTFDGVDYNRSLYGATGEKQYLAESWNFAPGISVTVVSAALGYLFPAVSAVCGVIDFVANILLSALSVNYWARDSYWNYRMVQSAPDYFGVYFAI